jgi:uncharacterized protein YciI
MDTHYLLFYDVADDYVTKRAAFRAAHLDHAWRAHARGELVLAGPSPIPWTEPYSCSAVPRRRWRRVSRARIRT